MNKQININATEKSKRVEPLNKIDAFLSVKKSWSASKGTLRRSNKRKGTEAEIK